MMRTHCIGIFRRAEDTKHWAIPKQKEVARSPLIPMIEFLDNTEFTSKDACCGLTIRAFSTAGRIGKPVFPAHASPFPLHSHIFFFLPAGFLQAFNQGQYVLNQHFSFYATLSFKAFCSWLATELLPISSESSPPHRAHIGHLPRALQVPRRQVGLERISGSAYQAVAPLRGFSFQEPDSWVVRRSTGGQQAQGMPFVQKRGT